MLALLIQQPNPEHVTVREAGEALLAYSAACILLGVIVWLLSRFLLPRLHGYWPLCLPPWQLLLTGIACALVPQLVAVGGALLAGGFASTGSGWTAYSYVFSPQDIPSGWMVWLFFGVQSTAEELLFRGIGLALLAGLLAWLARLVLKTEDGLPPSARLTWFGSGLLANLVVCAAFASVHSRNPAVSSVALWNIALAGFALGQLYLLQGRLWGCCAMHIWWNAGLASLGLPVSGIDLRGPLLGAIRGGVPGILTGGDFGPEASILTSLGLAGVSSWLVWRRGRLAAAGQLRRPLDAATVEPQG
jgi:hypothetical protein